MEPVMVYRFLIIVANGYRIQCGAILGHFETAIKRIVEDSLNLYSSQASRQNINNTGTK